MAESADISLLRRYLDDVMPTDGTDPDFSTDELQATLDRANGNVEQAAVEGWRMKAAAAAALVDVTEGNASRAMSDMQGHALAMVKQFELARTGPTDGRTTLGRIRRRYR